ncbi:DNA-binding response regulator [Patiriisocius marinistellae]|uniref:DNA-binding response regulator n=1 Tax=Patiriisocius marinistellae TaxID=2494560 RepID=A0A5J4FZX3_9FLAO|nr:response regulator transcription factor [Patiriisocius marinistellae]GEQ85769.1 DNA-binding response regulator [Patiriisocius marinistellae]
MSTKITMVLADDEQLFRQGMRAILNRVEEFEILFDAADGKDLVDQLRVAETLPDIIITDLKMPELNGVEATKLIQKEFPNCKVIALTSYFSKPFVVNMISIGAVAYLAKNSSPTLMVKTIKEVAEKGFFYDEKVLQFIKDGLFNKGKATKSRFDKNHLSTRESEVLQLICQQLTTNEIAEKLFISPRTVEGHRNNLLLKTEAKNSAGLVVYAIENGIVNLDPKY